MQSTMLIRPAPSPDCHSQQKPLRKTLPQPLAISPGIVYADPAPGDPSPAPAGHGLLGNSSMVELRTLTPSILVRIQVPQPNSP